MWNVTLDRPLNGSDCMRTSMSCDGQGGDLRWIHISFDSKKMNKFDVEWNIRRTVEHKHVIRENVLVTLLNIFWTNLFDIWDCDPLDIGFPSELLPRRSYEAGKTNWRFFEWQVLKYLLRNHRFLTQMSSFQAKVSPWASWSIRTHLKWPLIKKRLKSPWTDLANQEVRQVGSL